MSKGPGKSSRKLTSWIQSYLDYTANTPAPALYRLWSAIGTLGAALERRVWVDVGNKVTYPNLFILLVGRPGIGKSNAIDPATGILSAAEFNIAPSDTTKASFVKWLASEDARKRITLPGSTGFHEYHSAAVHVSELGVFIRGHELETLSVLSHLYDCPSLYENKRIYQGKEQIEIPHPQISILAGTQPGYIASVFPAEAWVQGFMARMILIYSGDPARPSLFNIPSLNRSLELELVHDLKDAGTLRGSFSFSPDAVRAIEHWYTGGMEPVPSFPRLETYNTRRIVHLLKLLQIASASRGNSMMIEEEDFAVARGWMLEAEAIMPEVFLEMAGRSDNDILRELHHYARSKYTRSGKPIHLSVLMSFLALKAPAWAAEKIFSMAVQTGYFKKVGHDLYEPQARLDPL